jgi:tRNA threonylcarbamoyladenosine biosynthesis protein TsaE
MRLRLRLEGEAAQEDLGRRLAPLLTGGWIVHLRGDLGAGKTTLARGILRGLGHTGAVKSPTYTLIEPYEPGGRRVYHLDLYRLGDPEELEYLGLRDLLGGEDLILVEWPERAGTALPPADLELRIAHASEARDLDIRGPGRAAAALIEALIAALPADLDVAAQAPATAAAATVASEQQDLIRVTSKQG